MAIKREGGFLQTFGGDMGTKPPPPRQGPGSPPRPPTNPTAQPGGSPLATGGGQSNMGYIVPPGGAQGFGQQTPATQALFIGGGGATRARGPSKRRRKTRARAASAPKRRAKAKRSKPARLVKGSAAAKRYMASIRRKRR